MAPKINKTKKTLHSQGIQARWNVPPFLFLPCSLQTLTFCAFSCHLRFSLFLAWGLRALTSCTTSFPAFRYRGVISFSCILVPGIEPRPHTYKLNYSWVIYITGLHVWWDWFLQMAHFLHIWSLHLGFASNTPTCHNLVAFPAIHPLHSSETLHNLV